MNGIHPILTANLVWLLGLSSLAAVAVPGAEVTAQDPFAYQDGAVVRGSRATRQVALVFTGHEFAEGGEAILEALARHGAKASFFLTGDFLRNASFTPLVRRILAEGHYVGPHSDRHRLYCVWTPDRRTLLTRAEFEADLNGNLRELERFGVTRRQPRFFLPAYEHHNRDISDWTHLMGLTLVSLSPGTRSAADYTVEKDPNFVPSQAIIDSILRRESEDPAGLNGVLLLMHLGSGPGRADKMHLRLPELLSRLKERGYAFERIDRLLGRHLRASQVGYPVQSPKLAVALASEPLSDRFDVIELDSGRSVLQSVTRPATGMNWGRFHHVAELDFSALRRPGRFRLRLGGAVSLPIVVDDAVFQPLPDLLLEFLRQQRCGFNPWLNAQCHQLDGRTAYGSLPAGTAVDARGGWHDAADLLKYLLTSSNATAQMLLAWELHRHALGQPSSGFPIATRRDGGPSPLFADRFDALGQAGANGLSDLLDEARWGLEWMLKLHPAPDQLYHQVADDRDHCGWRLPQNERADYGWGSGRDRVVYGADGRPQGLGRYPSESTGLANLAGRYAAAMALAFQIWKDDPNQVAFARRCLAASQEVYQLGRDREGVQQGNSYGAPYRYAETTWADDMEWGAAELFRATGNRHYLDDAKRYARLAKSESWTGREQTGHYQFYPFFNAGHFRLHGVVDVEFQSLLEGWYREGIEHCRAAGEKNPFGIGVPFIWCSNNLVVALVTQCALYEQMSGDGRYREFAARHRDWLLGRNPWGTTQFMGVGLVSPGSVHLMTTRLTGRPLRGGLVDGPVYRSIFESLKGVSITQPDPLAEFQDSRAVYHDDWQDYASNEPTMDGTASALLMWAVLQTGGAAAPERRSSRAVRPVASAGVASPPRTPAGGTVAGYEAARAGP
jgi:peptidoglycan/xylan/chitin deacetylase (PgdA/CDA1 family)